MPLKPCSRCKKNPRTGTSRGWCTDCNREYDREWRKKDGNQERRRLRDKSISQEDYNSILQNQGNRCAICGTDKPEGTWHIDHDHRCCPGQLTCGSCNRGLLCAKCNRSLGGFNDDLSILRSAVRYLESHNGEEEE